MYAYQNADQNLHVFGRLSKLFQMSICHFKENLNNYFLLFSTQAERQERSVKLRAMMEQRFQQMEERTKTLRVSVTEPKK